jgi:hypothetical protein
MRYLITTHLSMATALAKASSGDTIICQNESMRALGERGAKRHPDKELIFEVTVVDSVSRNFDRLCQLLRNFPNALKRAVAKDSAMAQSLENLLVHAREALEE